jgi:flagellar protein FliJ
LGFQFRYESLLNLRRHHKERAEIEYGKALGDFMHAENALQAMEKECGRVQGAFSETIQRAAAAHEVRNYAEYLKSLSAQARNQEEKVQNLKKMVAEKKKELLEKTKKYKVIETLRDKDFEKWQKHENDVEQKRINELAVLRHGRTYV